MRRILFALALAAAAIPAQAAFAATTGNQSTCIDMRRQASWKAADEKTLYIVQNKSSVYAVEFANGCPRMDSPFAKFIDVQRSGSSWICTPIDLDIRVSETPGFSTACLATGIRQLTPAEIAALPKKIKP